MFAAIASFFATLFAPLLAVLVKAKVEAKPQATEEGELAGSSSTIDEVQSEEIKNVQKGSDAGDAVVRATSSDSGLSKYEATDPNNRDNN
jgi:Na+/citrate or Na+/malate symporter